MYNLKILNNSQTFGDDPIFNLGFEDCITDNTNILLHLDCLKSFNANDPKFNSAYKHYLLDLELPNRWMTEQQRLFGLKNEERYEKIFCIDPYFTLCRNKQLGIQKYKTVFFPFNEKNIIYSKEKPHNVFYSGHIKQDMMDIKNVIDKFGGILVANNGGIRVSYKEKLKLNAESKISIVHNFLELNIHGEERESFKKLNCTEIKNDTLTQHKARVIEAAMLGSFMLCKKDEYNIIEQLFTEGKHFLYFSNPSELEQLINDILLNYEKYKILAQETAKFARSEYTTQQFVNKYINL